MRPEAIGNRLLASLQPDFMAALLPKLQRVPLAWRQVLQQPDTPIRHVYFPETGMISLVAVLDDGRRAEVGIVGREGMFGASLAAGVNTIFTEANVQLPGTALRMPAGDFVKEVAAGGAFRAIVLRYSESLSGQISYTAACNSNHDIERRLARWLLMAHDRAGQDELPLTHDLLATMLGVRRPSVTLSAKALQRAGLISTSRAGRLSIVDRPGLEKAACECYFSMQRRFSSVMSPNI